MHHGATLIGVTLELCARTSQVPYQKVKQTAFIHPLCNEMQLYLIIY